MWIAEITHDRITFLTIARRFDHSSTSQGKSASVLDRGISGGAFPLVAGAPEPERFRPRVLRKPAILWAAIILKQIRSSQERDTRIVPSVVGYWITRQRHNHAARTLDGQLV